MKKLILSPIIFFSLLGAWSSASAADIHFACNARSFNTVNGMDKYEKEGKIDIYIRGNVINITGFIIQPYSVYLKSTTDEWGLDHKISYDYGMPIDYSDGSWDVGNIVVDRREKNPIKWWETVTSFSLDKRYGQLRFRQHMFNSGFRATQNLEGACKEVGKESLNSKLSFLDFFRF